MPDSRQEVIIRLTRVALTAAAGWIVPLAACADEPAPAAQLGPHDGFELPPVRWRFIEVDYRVRATIPDIRAALAELRQPTAERQASP